MVTQGQTCRTCGACLAMVPLFTVTGACAQARYRAHALCSTEAGLCVRVRMAAPTWGSSLFVPRLPTLC